MASTLALQLASYTKASEMKESASEWAVPFVTTAISQNLVPEHLQTDYTAPITRAEFCALAVALYEEKIGSEIEERASFSDTTDVNVEKAASIGVVSGRSEGVFEPNAEITRQEAAIILSQLALAIGINLSEGNHSFSDAEHIATWASDSVGKVQNSGIMSGVNETEFSPLGTYTREQSITTLLRVFELQGNDTLYQLENFLQIQQLQSNLVPKVGETVDLIVSILNNFEDYLLANESLFIVKIKSDFDELKSVSNEIFTETEKAIELCGEAAYLEKFSTLALIVKSNYKDISSYSLNLEESWESARRQEISEELSTLFNLTDNSFQSFKEAYVELGVILATLKPSNNTQEDTPEDTPEESTSEETSSFSEILSSINSVENDVIELTKTILAAGGAGNNAFLKYNTTKSTSYLSTMNSSSQELKSDSISISRKLTELIELCGTHQEFEKYKLICLTTQSYYDSAISEMSNFNAMALLNYGTNYVSTLSSWNNIVANVTDGANEFIKAIEEYDSFF